MDIATSQEKSKKGAKRGPKKPAPRRSANDWVMAAFAVLAVSGINDVKVERLAKDLGVTKGSFYWHFDDRPALLDAMLEAWVRIDTEQIIELVDARPESEEPVVALKRLMQLTMGVPTDFDGVEAGVREWSVHDPKAAAVCSEVDERRLVYVTGLLMAAGVDKKTAAARAGILYRVVIGEYSWRRYGGSPANLEELLKLVEVLALP